MQDECPRLLQVIPSRLHLSLAPIMRHGLPGLSIPTEEHQTNFHLRCMRPSKVYCGGGYIHGVRHKIFFYRAESHNNDISAFFVYLCLNDLFEMIEFIFLLVGCVLFLPYATLIHLSKTEGDVYYCLSVRNDILSACIKESCIERRQILGKL